MTKKPFGLEVRNDLFKVYDNTWVLVPLNNGSLVGELHNTAENHLEFLPYLIETFNENGPVAQIIEDGLPRTLDKELCKSICPTSRENTEYYCKYQNMQYALKNQPTQNHA